jgi:hypothetical protein
VAEGVGLIVLGEETGYLVHAEFAEGEHPYVTIEQDVL